MKTTDQIKTRISQLKEELAQHSDGQRISQPICYALKNQIKALEWVIKEEVVYFTCPNCHCDNQDMLVGMGENMMMCEACDHEFHETKA